MRVAFSTFPNSLVRQLATLTSQQARLQNQAATGRRISQLEDDPAAMRRVLTLQTQDSQLAQYRQNIATLQGRTAAAFAAVQGLEKLSTRAGEVASLADGTRSTKDLQVFAIEVNHLIEQGVQTLNTRYQDDYLFGGTKTSQPPFRLVTDAAGTITGVSYQGNAEAASVEIGDGYAVSTQIPGANTSGSGPGGLVTDSRNGADFFNHLIALRDHLLAGDVSAIAATDRAALAKDEDNITLQAGTIGFMRSQLAAADTLASSQSASIKELISQDADADLAQVLTRLGVAQTAYQAALQSGASLMNRGQSLMDYLR
jgi:flagellar hook-associated protein 3 FlgL